MFSRSYSKQSPINCTYLVKHLTRRRWHGGCVPHLSYSYPTLNTTSMYQEISVEVPNIQFYEDLFPGPRVIKSGRQFMHTIWQAYRFTTQSWTATHFCILSLRMGHKRQMKINEKHKKYYVKDTKTTSRTNGQFSLIFLVKCSFVEPPYSYIILIQPTIHTYIHTYLLTPWCRVLLEKLTGLQLVKKFPAFHGTRRFITALTSVRHLSLSWARPIQSIYPHPTSWRSILILPTHLRLGLPSGLFPSGFPTSRPSLPHTSIVSKCHCNTTHIDCMRICGYTAFEIITITDESKPVFAPPPPPARTQTNKVLQSSTNSQH